MSSAKRGIVVSESVEEQVRKISPNELPQAIDQAKKDAKALKDQIEKAKQANNDASCTYLSHYHHPNSAT